MSNFYAAISRELNRKSPSLVKQLMNGVTTKATSTAHYRYYFVEECLSARHGRNWRTKLWLLSRLNSIRRPPRPSVSYSDICFESLTHCETSRFCFSSSLFKDNTKIKIVSRKNNTATHSWNYLWREASCFFIYNFHGVNEIGLVKHFI